jgi:exonuclease VII large subunit
MAKGKHNNLTNRNQDYLASSKPSTPTTASPGYPNLKSYLMILVDNFKKNTSNYIKEIQNNTATQVDVLKEKTQKFLKELQQNTTKQVKALNKIIQYLNMEVETKKKRKRQTTLEIKILLKKSGDIDASIINRKEEMEERISGTGDFIENMETTIKENAKSKEILTQNIKEIKDTMRRPNLRKTDIDENEDFQLKGPINIFNKFIEENFPNLKKEMPMNIH